jgi:hypothetical protein
VRRRLLWIVLLLGVYGATIGPRAFGFEPDQEPLSTAKAAAPRATDAELAALPPWRRYAAVVDEPILSDGPVIAVVIDDLGRSAQEIERIVGFGVPLTLAFLPYPKESPGLAQRARAAGLEIMVHVPMEPNDPRHDPGPDALRVDESDVALRAALARNLAPFKDYVGINNHMGSRFTRNRHAMEVVLGELKARGLLFVDSLTAPGTQGRPLARRLDLPFARRDVFIDPVIERATIEAQLEALERVARSAGYAVGIGHPFIETLDALAHWLPEARQRGVRFVPISSIAALECAC